MTDVRRIRMIWPGAVVALATLFLSTPFDLYAGGIGEDPSLETVPAGISVDYDVLSDTIVTEEFSIRGNAVSYGVGFSEGGGTYNDRRAAGPGGSSLQYQILTSISDGTVVKDLDGAPDGSGLIEGSIPISFGRTTVTDTFDVIVYQGQLRIPGTYTDTVTLTLYATDDTPSPSVEEAIVPIAIFVDPFVELSIVDPGGGFDADADNVILDFGSLTEGLRRSLDLLIRGNVDYVVTVDSMNGGVMGMIPATYDDAVPYTLEVDGTPRDLSQGTTQVLTGNGPTSLGGNRHTLEFEIGTVAGATSGTYEDNLTITVTAQ
jgi:spore coat protein U-like protein